MSFDVADADFEERVRASFARQGLNRTIGATLRHVAPGRVEIEVPFSAGISQQHGFFHGGVMGAIGDSACGYAALTLAPANAEVLTVEYKVNFLSPGRGDRLIARGRVAKPGRTVTVCAGDVFAMTGDQETLVATMLVTIMTVGGRREDSPPPRPSVHDIDAQDRSGSPRWCPCRRLRTLGRFLTVRDTPRNLGASGKPLRTDTTLPRSR
jgi:uncharacterized protein (TIGR00369 family)